MQKSNLPQGVRTLEKWYSTNTLKFDLPIQRASGQWSPLQKSLLIHSLLADFPVPPLYFIKYKGKDDNVTYQALDGKQRCTSIFEFISGDYKLHASTPKVKIYDKEVELANKEFNDLSDDIKDLISGYRFTIYLLEDATDEEIEEAFARLNASTPLTLIQKARTEMGTELAQWTRKMTNMSFFQQAIPLTLAQARRESELEILLQSMLLMDAKDVGYNYKAISMREVTKYCRDIRGNYSESRRQVIQTIIEYLSEAFQEKTKFLKKTNAVMVFVIADLAMQHDITPQDFKKFIYHTNMRKTLGQAMLRKTKQRADCLPFVRAWKHISNYLIRSLLNRQRNQKFLRQNLQNQIRSQKFQWQNLQNQIRSQKFLRQNLQNQ